MPTSHKTTPLSNLSTTTTRPNTRSNSSSAPLPPSPSNSDLMTAILNIQTFQSTQFEELRGCLTKLTHDVSHLQKENNSLRAELSSLKTKFDNLDVGSTTPTTTAFAAQLLRENSESNKCAFSAILYGITESRSASAALRIADDNAEVSRVLESISLPVSNNFKLFRLGGPSSRKPRPLKMIFSTKDEAASLLRSYRSALNTGLKLPDNLRIVRDKTTLERQLLRSSHAELELRQQSGESDLCISYINGVPSVVKSKPKN